MTDFLIDMFGIRDPYKSELNFFKGRPEVAGMATEDNKIILNPYSKLSKQEQQAVANNEAIRLFMKVAKVSPEFELTPEQTKVFKGTEYEQNPVAARQTLLARILSGDPSAKDVTEEQQKAAQDFLTYVEQFKPTR
jgi:hypothetical protein